MQPAKCTAWPISTSSRDPSLLGPSYITRFAIFFNLCCQGIYNHTDYNHFTSTGKVGGAESLNFTSELHSVSSREKPALFRGT